MTTYPGNLSNGQWAMISNFFDIKRRRKYDLREIVNAIMYLVKTGCQWRMLPRDLPSWKKDITWEAIHEVLVMKIRKRSGKHEEPSVGIIDAQSVKNTLVSSEDKGFDAGKRIKGIKRHIIADTLGMILAVVIQSASLQDHSGATEVIKQMKLNWIKVIVIFADGGYAGKLIEKVKTLFGIDIKIVKRNEQNKFKVLPKRCIVERTFSWIDTNRRNSKNYERLNSQS